jgi:hypothetical protein
MLRRQQEHLGPLITLKVSYIRGLCEAQHARPRQTVVDIGNQVLERAAFRPRKSAYEGGFGRIRQTAMVSWLPVSLGFLRPLAQAGRHGAAAAARVARTAHRALGAGHHCKGPPFVAWPVFMEQVRVTVNSDDGVCTSCVGHPSKEPILTTAGQPLQCTGRGFGWRPGSSRRSPRGASCRGAHRRIGYVVVMYVKPGPIWLPAGLRDHMSYYPRVLDRVAQGLSTG